jgi:hypothetical protein
LGALARTSKEDDMKAVLAVATLALASGTAFAQQPAPARDARGIPVVSEQPTVPTGVNQTVTAPPGATFQYSTDTSAFAARPATATYPPCERGQTDRCTQTYEGRRGATRARRGRR